MFFMRVLRPSYWPRDTRWIQRIWSSVEHQHFSISEYRQEWTALPSCHYWWYGVNYGRCRSFSSSDYFWDNISPLSCRHWWCGTSYGRHQSSESRSRPYLQYCIATDDGGVLVRHRQDAAGSVSFDIERSRFCEDRCNTTPYVKINFQGEFVK